jgi:hypothetical protein
MKPEASANQPNLFDSVMETQASQTADLTTEEAGSQPNPVAGDRMPEVAEESPALDQPPVEEEGHGAVQEGAQEHPEEAQVEQ